MNPLRHLALIALLTALLVGCGKGSGSAAIPTAGGAKVERSDVESMGIGTLPGVQKRPAK